MRINKLSQIVASAVVSAVVFAGGAGCQSKAGTGALAGGAGGAALGAIIGHQSGHAGTGALIGGALGAGGGYVVGNEMDKSDARKERERQRFDDPYAGSSYAVTKQDVINWTMRNTTDEVIIGRIRQSRSTFRLTAADEQELRDNGVSPRVIDEMKRRA